MPFVVHHYASLGSTNDHLKQMIDAPEFTCVTADEQTAGRGRRDRSWHSAAGVGLYLSILLRPASATPPVSLLSLLTAIAVAETIQQEGVAGVDIKWPNDVLINERKVCGILIEGVNADAAALRFIVGIGVNLNQQSFPPELAETATSLLCATGRQIAVAAFRDQLLARFAYWYRCWQGGEARAVTERWQKLSSYASNQPIIVALDDEQFSGVTAGLTDDGALLVHTNTGELRTLFTGEVSRLRKLP